MIQHWLACQVFQNNLYALEEVFCKIVFVVGRIKGTERFVGTEFLGEFCGLLLFIVVLNRHFVRF